jgi:hypothetical protein
MPIVKLPFTVSGPLRAANCSGYLLFAWLITHFHFYSYILLMRAFYYSCNICTSWSLTQFCLRCYQQCPIHSFIQLDRQNRERILQYCSNCRDYFALRHEQNAAIGIGTPASLPNNSQASEECSRLIPVFLIFLQFIYI